VGIIKPSLKQQVFFERVYMKVLIVSTNTLPASPSGPAYIAGPVRQAGHQVAAYETLFATDLAGELKARLIEFQPDVVGVSIRLVFGDVQDASAPLGTRHIDLRPRVREIVDIIRQNTNACIVLGGPGFNYYATDWLDYLGVDYGICGEGEEAFPLFLQRFAEGGDIYSVPGCVYRKDGRILSVPPRWVKDLDGAALPAYDLFDLEKYAEYKITPAIFTKRGCAFSCTYCPYSKLEGKRYRVKSPERILAEIRSILAHCSPGAASHRIMFCDNNFNVPKRHAEVVCRALISTPLNFQWGTGDLKPIGVTDDFCRLMEDSGCFYVNLAIESASDTMLQRMKRGYTVRQVRESLEVLSRSGIPLGASLMLGAPGETPDTIAETIKVLDDYFIPLGVWVTLGIYLWTDLQDIVAEARQAGLLRDDEQLFSGVVYLSPELPRPYLAELIDSLRLKPGYTVQVNKPDEQWML
jgi:radical SAM superfamily enzyme YgiQ (UPF0313 family)